MFTNHKRNCHVYIHNTEKDVYAFISRYKGKNFCLTVVNYGKTFDVVRIEYLKVEYAQDSNFCQFRKDHEFVISWLL